MTKFLIEEIEFPKLLEGGSGNKGIAVSALGEREAVGRNPVIIVMLQAVQGKGFILHDQTPCFQEVELFLIGSGGFTHRKSPPQIERIEWEKETPLGAHRGEAWEVLLGAL
jgi:hypothetical protein